MWFCFVPSYGQALNTLHQTVWSHLSDDLIRAACSVHYTGIRVCAWLISCMRCMRCMSFFPHFWQSCEGSMFLLILSTVEPLLAWPRVVCGRFFWLRLNSYVCAVCPRVLPSNHLCMRCMILFLFVYGIRSMYESRCPRWSSGSINYHGRFRDFEPAPKWTLFLSEKVWLQKVPTVECARTTRCGSTREEQAKYVVGSG